MVTEKIRPGQYRWRGRCSKWRQAAEETGQLYSGTHGMAMEDRANLVASYRAGLGRECGYFSTMLTASVN